MEQDYARHLAAGGQILKTRDDPRPVFLAPAEDSGARMFTAVPPCSWAGEEAFGSEKIRPRIEPWLTALVQSEHLSLLLGSGLTHAVHSIATGRAAAGMGKLTFSAYGAEIDADALRAATQAGRSGGNIEDQIRSANDLFRGLQVLGAGKDTKDPLHERAKELAREMSIALGGFADSILASEQTLANADEEPRTNAFNYLVAFLLSFGSRSGTRERLHLFTTNYDRYVEARADVAGLRLLDRFVGALAPVFRASRLNIDLHYNPPGIRGEPRYLEGVARYTKLHGSVDWVDTRTAIRRLALPFGAARMAPYLDAPGFGADPSRIMVYPNAAKDRETSFYPYVELFRDYAAAVCRPNSTMVTYGYSFGDDHINRVLEDMLTIPSAHLVVIAHGDPLGRIMTTYDRLGRHDQISLLVGNHLGDLRALVDNYLPKSAIDRTTSRMARLLEDRWGVSKRDSAPTHGGQE
jgi:hypothetical protein